MARRRGPHGRLTRADQLEVRRRIAAGERYEAVAAALGCSTKSVQRLLAASGGVPPRSRRRSPLRLSLAEREEISRGLRAGSSCRASARGLGRSPSTVSREVSANGGRRAAGGGGIVLGEPAKPLRFERGARSYPSWCASRRRRHTSIDDLSPVEYERLHAAAVDAA